MLIRPLGCLATNAGRIDLQLSKTFLELEGTIVQVVPWLSFLCFDIFLGQALKSMLIFCFLREDIFGVIFSQFVTQLLTTTSYVQAQGNNKKWQKLECWLVARCWLESIAISTKKTNQPKTRVSNIYIATTFKWKLSN